MILQRRVRKALLEAGCQVRGDRLVLELRTPIRTLPEIDARRL